MTLRLALSALLATVSILLSFSTSQAATQIGKVAAVLGSPNASGPGGDRKLSAGSAVFEDDKITVRTGNAQIILNDNTRLVVGPGSSLVLDRFIMKGGNQAQKVSIKALRGTFRFISGRSAKSAYDIQTASATIGIRGTGFDYWVRGQTGVAVMVGVVRLSSGGEAVLLQNTCEVGRAGSGNAEELALGPAGRNIVQNLPFILNQSSLRTQFRLPVERCARALQRTRTLGGLGNENPPQKPEPPPERPQPID